MQKKHGKKPVGALPEQRVSWRLTGSLLCLLFCFVSSGYSRLIPLTVYHTADMHACFVAEDVPQHPAAVGWLACGSVILQERAASINSLLIHCGDLFCGAFPGGAAHDDSVLAMLERMGYDIWVPGLHDFAAGAAHFMMRSEKAPCSVLAANLSHRNDFSEFQGGQIIRRDGICIAVAGLTSPLVPSYYLQDRLDGLWFHDPVQSLFPVMRSLREERPDIWILVAHQGLFYKDNPRSRLHSVLRAYPEFDLVLGGESHACIQSKRVGDTWFTQAGSYGCYAGKVDLVYDNVQHRLVSVQPTCITVRLDQPIHPMLADMGGHGSRVKDEVLMSLDQQLLISAQEELPSFFRLMCRAAMQRTNAEIILYSFPKGLTSINPGAFTQRDLFRLLPDEDSVVTCSMTVDDLQKMIRCIDVQTAEGENICLWGVQRSGTGDELVLRESSGRPLHPRKRYVVAVGSRLAASDGGRYRNVRDILEQPECVMTNHSVLIRDMTAAYIRQGGLP